jgi:hypothetical protein
MQESGGITINFPQVDWAQLIPQLVGYFFEGTGTFLNKALHSAFDGVWGSGANVLGQTDLAMTWGFGPVHEQVLSVQGAARAVLLFALVVLGLRTMLGGIVPRQPEVLAEFINGVLVAVILVAAFPLLVPEIIRLNNVAATAVGTADLSRYLSSVSVNNPMLQVVFFVILLFFAVRLLVKAVWRIGFLAVFLPVGIAACALWAIPQTRWLLGWWARAWGGMLLAQIPSVMALSIGAQLWAFGGVAGFIYAIAFLQLATDLYTLIPFGSVGSSGAPWGSLPWRAPLAAWGGGAGAAVGAATRAAWPAGATAGHMAGMYGYQ